MKELILIYLGTIIVSCFLGLIFCYRALKKYKRKPLPGKCLLRAAWMMFSLLIPVLNLVVFGYYSIFLFDKILEKNEN